MKFMKRILNVLRNAAALGVAAVLLAPVAHAQTPDLGLNFATATGLGTTDIRTTVARIISYFLGLLGIIVVGLIIYAGYTWMMAGGDAEKVSTAKRILTEAVIGLAIILAAFAIVQFIFGAVEQGSGLLSSNGCPQGQTCVTGGLTAGGAGGFRIQSIAPAYDGPNHGGWPRNFSLTVSFNAPVAGDSATPANIQLQKCNSRLNGSAPAPFQLSACGSPLAAALTVSGNRVLVQPKDTTGQPANFDADAWYRIFLQGGGVSDTTGRTLLCPPQLADPSTSAANPDYCERAAAFNAIIDTTPPTVTVNAPSGTYCASSTVRTATINATANDAWLVVGVDYLLDGSTDNLVDSNNDPMATSTNVDFDNPFDSADINVSLAPLNPGTHTISAVAHNGVPLPSSTATKTFNVVPGHCCNGAKDADETGIDCGGKDCGACDGSSCTQNSDCSSGFCNQTTHQCEDRPKITSVKGPGNKIAGGPGEIVTIDGSGFGTTPGIVTYLGLADHGDVTAQPDTDAKIATTCAPQAWTDTEVKVFVPSGATTGPIELQTSGGPSTRTDDGFSSAIPDFTVNTDTAPGICYLSPSEGPFSTAFSINGIGFGATEGTGTILMGSNPMTVVTCAGGNPDCGWSDTTVWAIAPPIDQNVYPVTVNTNSQTSNPSDFILQNDITTSAPHVTAVIPDSGPVGSYVTIQGNNFGSLKGKVTFTDGITKDVAFGQDPACDDNWHDNYIIVKVPANYGPAGDGLPLNVSSAGVAHNIQVITSTPSFSSNTDVTFGVTNGPPQPGICSLTPDNGPPTSLVAVQGEGFGAGPGSATVFPRYSVNFYKSSNDVCLDDGTTPCTTLGASCNGTSICVPDTVPSANYSSWNNGSVIAYVPGLTTYACSKSKGACDKSLAGLPCTNPTDGTCTADRSSWPSSGPVYVIANNQLSGNAVPFTVQDCNDSGVKCASGTQCCSNGSCQASCVPVPKTSAYGWHFSTSVLPSLPIVIENAECDIAAKTMQSPSPAKNATDACVNAQIFFEFNRGIDTTTFTAKTVLVEECVDKNGQPDCTAATPVAIQLPGSFTGCDDATHCATFQTQPDVSYNGGLFKKNTWYRVTLVSNPAASSGLHDSGGIYLDGDLDKRQGGNYVYTFKTQNSDNPCTLSNVEVQKSPQLVTDNTTVYPFNAELLADNCESLDCDAKSYAVSWSSVLQYLIPAPPQPTSICGYKVKAKSETPVGTPTELAADVAPIPLTAVPPKEGSADVTVKFADPKVVSVMPTADCKSACINAEIGAGFNVPIDASTVNSNTVHIWRCRNATCAAPYAQGLDVADDISTSVSLSSDGLGLTVKLWTAAMAPAAMSPNTFYTVRIMGGASGVKSQSGVPLTGLNDGNFYEWKFQTKNDPTACSVARTDLSPKTATLFYVGQRQDFTATAFGSPDACSSGGQQLSASFYDWGWTLPSPNYVLGGFINGLLPTVVAPTSLVTTQAPAVGCTSQCTLAGSQNIVPQCGDGDMGGINAKYKACDDGAKNGTAGDPCTSNCLLRGNTAANGCGDHVIDSAKGEECDMLPDPQNPGQYIWPPGCKQPGVHVDGFADDIGCIEMGASSVPNSKCGDGLIEDGKECDDGNTVNGDGCSSDCLFEGALPSCSVAAGKPCTDVCGNGIVEPGEDPGCEVPKNPAKLFDPVTNPVDPTANGCDPKTCLELGAQPLSAGGTCGDSKANEPGKECDDGALNGTSDDGCSANCLLKGSSAFYASPSFCGDGQVGTGEAQACELPLAATNVNPYQVASANPQLGFDPKTADSSTVKAAAGDVADANAGSAQVSLSCTCKDEPAGSQDSYCAGFKPDLACADNGCCILRPTVTSYSPTSYAACRNSGVSITFSDLMNESSVTSNFAIGYDNGNAAAQTCTSVTTCAVTGGCACVVGNTTCTIPNGKTSCIESQCPDGTTPVLPLATAAAPASLFQRLWNGAVKFIHDAILRPAFGAPPNAIGSEASDVFCSVPGTVTLKTSGTAKAGDQKTILDFAPTRAFPANKYIRIRLYPGVKSALGVPLLSDTGNDWTQYFGTQADVCPIKDVRVMPSSVLLSSVSDTQTVTAQALAADNSVIVPTIDYRWDWGWDYPPESSAVVLTPKYTNATLCSNGATCTDAGGCPCQIGGTSCPVPIQKGQDTCAINATLMTSDADLRVRGSVSTDVTIPAGRPPQNSNGAISVNAIADVYGVDATGKLTTTGITSQSTTNSGTVTVMLCNNPWPSYQTCDATGHAKLPWDLNNPVTCPAPNVDVWYPFYDPLTNASFSYCRDIVTTSTSSSGPTSMAKQPKSVADVSGMVKSEFNLLDSTPLGTLPCLSEVPAVVSSPGSGIIKEFLFTFDKTAASTPSSPDGCSTANGWAPPTGNWQNDAIGLRVSSNSTHESIGDWYFDKGFRGSPSPATVDGYEALTEGRTAYVNAGALTGNGQLYTNVNVLSYSDGAQPETTSIFQQLLGTVNFNGTATSDALMNDGICRQGPTRVNSADGEVPALRCDTDKDCQVDDSGAPVPGREAYKCDVASGTCTNGASASPTAEPDAGISVPCDSDNDCLVDASGNPIPNRPSTYACDAPKSKLQRDVRRWSDLTTLRNTLISSANSVGSFPVLSAGTFLRAQTNSAWPSWTSALNASVGSTALPTDPLNSLGPIPSDLSQIKTTLKLTANPVFDPKTGWDATDRLYVCPTDSHVYDYHSIGGTDFQLHNDFEYQPVTGGTAAWSGTTCLEFTDSATCTGNSLCEWTNDSCNYKLGKIYIGNSVTPFPTTANCSGTPVAPGTGSCGDGIVQSNETCEIGQTKSVPGCNSNPAAAPAGSAVSPRVGSSVEVCNSTCSGWNPVGKCSDNSMNYGVTCIKKADCTGGGFCINDPSNTGFYCSDGTDSGKNCKSNIDCTKGGICENACIAGYCGDGVVQNPPETCDDGPLNGTYGHCNSTCTGYGFSCGDGQKQPNEACDCGSQNGQYHFNGVLASTSESGKCPAGGDTGANDASCSWDCSGPGPRCGDGIVNGDEQCDGGFQQFKGYCNDNAQTGCNASSDCPSIGTCQIREGDTVGSCSNGNGVSCSSDSDCVSSCGNFCQGATQMERRSCNPNNPAITTDDIGSNGDNGNNKACEWSYWSCTSPGTCGDGNPNESGKECDTGLPDDNHGACIIDPTRTWFGCVGGSSPGRTCKTDSDCSGSGATCQNIGYMCKKAFCGDGYVDTAAGEECDDGPLNGRVCTPKYGLDCNYCSSSCRVVTVSGPYCGDNFVQGPTSTPPGPEECDGLSGLSTTGPDCTSDADCTASKTNHGVDGTCENGKCTYRSEICVSTQSKYQAYGLVTGYAGCTLKSCQFGCLDSNSQPCDNDALDLSQTPPAPFINTDGDKCPTPPSDSPPADPLITTQADIAWAKRFGINQADIDYCNKLKNMEAVIGTSKFLALPAGTPPPTLNDNCDPDKDNDGVPDIYDCGPTAADIHPAYQIPGGPSVPAAEDDFCDGVDHDCSGHVDNWMDVEGKLVNVQTGYLPNGVQIEFQCNGTTVYTTNASEFQPDGTFAVHHQFNDVPCENATSMTWQVVYKAKGMCGDTTGTISGYKFKQCVGTPSAPIEINGTDSSGNPIPIYVTFPPTPGQIRAVATWGSSPSDLDFNLFASDKVHLSYNSGVSGEIGKCLGGPNGNGSCTVGDTSGPNGSNYSCNGAAAGEGVCTGTYPGTCTGSDISNSGASCNVDSDCGDVTQNPSIYCEPSGFSCVGGPDAGDNCTSAASCNNTISTQTVSKCVTAYCIGGPNPGAACDTTQNHDTVGHNDACGVEDLSNPSAVLGVCVEQGVKAEILDPEDPNDLTKGGGVYTLDHDATSGFGPETITITEKDPSTTYRFVLHKYSSDSGNIQDSPSQISIYATSSDGSCMQETFKPPFDESYVKKDAGGGADLCVFQTEGDMTYDETVQGHDFSDWPFLKCPKSNGSNAIFIKPGLDSSTGDNYEDEWNDKGSTIPSDATKFPSY